MADLFEQQQSESDAFEKRLREMDERMAQRRAEKLARDGKMCGKCKHASEVITSHSDHRTGFFVCMLVSSKAHWFPPQTTCRLTPVGFEPGECGAFYARPREQRDIESATVSSEVASLGE